MDLKQLRVPATLEQERDSRLTIFGFLLEEVEGDGNCLLRAISQQLWRSQAYYELLRRIVVAQLNLHRDLYKNVISSDLEYRQAVRDCSTLNCSVPIVAAYAIADVVIILKSELPYLLMFSMRLTSSPILQFEVEFVILCSYSPLTPFSLVKPQDPRTISRKGIVQQLISFAIIQINIYIFFLLSLLTVLYLCTTKESLGDELGHCNSMVPMHSKFCFIINYLILFSFSLRES